MIVTYTSTYVSLVYKKNKEFVVRKASEEMQMM